MMNWDKHRYTAAQLRLNASTRRWKLSGRGSAVFQDHEVLRRHPRPEQKHPAYRRRRRKHPAYYSIRYIRSGKVRIHKLAWFRYHKTLPEKLRALEGRRLRHPLLQTV
jgi:hypothetical protein